MKKWQRITGWILAGAGLVILALWLSRLNHSTPAGVIPAAAKGTNSTAKPSGSPGKAPSVPVVGAFPGAKPGLSNQLAAGAPPRVLPRPVGRTNFVPLTASQLPGKAGVAVKPGAATNAVAPAPSGAAKFTSLAVEKFQAWKASPSFVPVLSASVFGLILIGLLISRMIQSKRAGASPEAGGLSASSQFARRKASQGTVHSCNVLQVGEFGRQIWHFGARSGTFVLNREQKIQGGEPLPVKLIARDWRTLLQRKLNIAWIPPEHVFLRVAHLPLSDFNETVAMVELQLEKLSPIPVTQIVWSLQILPQAHEHERTVIVIIAARSVVEEFLGQLEGQGFLADRLEVPALDQLQATTVSGDGAWIYPAMVGGKYMGLAAWWYGGVLENLDLLNLPASQRAAGLKEQVMQMAWAGELEGWLTATPRWHLVADPVTVADWEPALREALGEPVEVIAPVPASRLAALTATRATRHELQANLLPPEFSNRYQQQFVDRLWMGSVGLVLGLYLLGVAIYGVAVGYLTVQTHAIEGQVAELGPQYTNALATLDRYRVLSDRQDLKYASLDCWRVLAELLPTDVTMEGYNFSEGKKLSLNGVAPADQQQRLLEFEKAMRKAKANNDKLLFDPVKGETLSSRLNPGGQTVTWNVSFELNRVEAQ